MLASLGDDDDLNSRRFTGTAALNRGNSRLGITAGTGRETLPAWLSGPNKTPSLRAEQNDLTVPAWYRWPMPHRPSSIAGTARA
ncbi:hypothetical protein G6F59_018478 [Rhizopus arrhizus]|nr:hypothetical protein G6F59_018478 [Rhizopus arrhizus]